MAKDEYGKLPPEFESLPNEFNEKVAPKKKKLNKDKDKKRKSLMLKLVTGTLGVTMVASTSSAFASLEPDSTPVENVSDINVTEDFSVEQFFNGTYDYGDDVFNDDAATDEDANDTTEDILDTIEDAISDIIDNITGEEKDDLDSDKELHCITCHGTGMCLTCHNNGYVQCDVINTSCGRCKGSGVYICPDCNGSGTCPNCNGTGNGTDSDDFYLICDNCSGKGIICTGSAAADDQYGCGGSIVSNCKACDGTGKESGGSVCSWCKGTLHHLCPSFETHTECQECGGTGITKQ